MKIVFFEVNKEERSYLKANLPDLDLVFYEEKIRPEIIAEIKDAEIVSVFVNSEVRQEVIDALPNLKLITTRSTGFDHIDVDYAKKKNILVSSIPAYGSYTVAEFTFALMLNLSRKVSLAHHKMLEGSNFDLQNLQGFDLRGKILGVVGTGRIGKNVIKVARAFEMSVVAYDIFPDQKFALENNVTYVTFEELLKQSDIVTLHTIYNESTHHLINKNNITLMKKGAYLINTARGELVETDALITALEQGNLAGAGLDVLESERQMKDEKEILKSGIEKIKDFKTMFENHVLLDMPEVIVTPHMAFFSKEAQTEILRSVIENITSFTLGQPKNLL